MSMTAEFTLVRAAQVRRGLRPLTHIRSEGVVTKALCGLEPRGGWSKSHEAHATCERCIAKAADTPASRTHPARRDAQVLLILQRWGSIDVDTSINELFDLYPELG